MVQRKVLNVFLLTIVTLGIYQIVWFVKTKGELNARGAQIPTAWLWIVPIANFYWLWKYFEAAEQATNGQSSAILNFLLSFFVTPLIAMCLLQTEYNKLGGMPAIANTAPPVAGDPQAIAPAVPPAPVVPPAPTIPPAGTDQNQQPPVGPQPPLVQ